MNSPAELEPPSSLPPLTPAETKEFDRLRTQWSELGKVGFEWAVRPSGGDSDQSAIDAFFQSGVEIWSACARRARSLGLTIEGGEALDFGCGPGRIVRALAPTHERVLGVDVAPEMVALAARLNGGLAGGSFQLAQRPDLAGLKDGRFALTFSAYVFQHLPEWLTRRYLVELVRTTAPGGTIVFRFHGDLTVPVLRRLPSGLLAWAYAVAQRLRLMRWKSKGPWRAQIHRTSRVQEILAESGVELIAMERAPEPDGWMVSYWVYARRSSPVGIQGDPIASSRDRLIPSGRPF